MHERRVPYESRTLYVRMIGLHHVKQANDTLGHAAGDPVPQAVVEGRGTKRRDETAWCTPTPLLLRSAAAA